VLEYDHQGFSAARLALDWRKDITVADLGVLSSFAEELRKNGRKW
jgi:hypothetical protein